MAARRERGLFDPEAAPGTSPFDHQIFVIASDGDLQEGVTSEASSIAGTQELGNLTVIWDDNHISIEGDTDIAFTEDVVGALRGVRLARAVRRLDADRGRLAVPRGRRRARRRAGRGRRGDLPAVVHRAAHDHRLAVAGQAEHPRRPRLQARRRRGQGPQGGPGLGPGEDVRRRPRGPGAHPSRSATAARSTARTGTPATTRGARPTRTAPPCWTGCRPASCPTAGRTSCRRSPRASRSRPAPRRARSCPRWRRCCPSCGAARPTSPARTTRR